MVHLVYCEDGLEAIASRLEAISIRFLKVFLCPCSWHGCQRSQRSQYASLVWRHAHAACSSPCVENWKTATAMKNKKEREAACHCPQMYDQPRQPVSLKRSTQSFTTVSKV